jgi:hypothetical protein
LVFAREQVAGLLRFTILSEKSAGNARRRAVFGGSRPEAAFSLPTNAFQPAAHTFFRRSKSLRG